MTKLHGVLIVIFGVVNATHHTLIITKEKDGQGSHAIDSNEKAALLELVNDVGPWNHVHGDVGPMGLVEIGVKKVSGRPCALDRMQSRRGPKKREERELFWGCCGDRCLFDEGRSVRKKGCLIYQRFTPQNSSFDTRFGVTRRWGGTSRETQS